VPLALPLTPGQTADTAAAPELLALGQTRPRELLADKGCGRRRPARGAVSARRAPDHPVEVEPQNPCTLDRRHCARRNCIERMMALLKQFRRVATRYDKTAESFLSFAQLAAILRWMRFVHTA
jgi:transposase